MTWAHAYGNATNTGFANVATQSALRDERRLSGLGRFLSGARPVIGPDGTVYLGNADGCCVPIRPQAGSDRCTTHLGEESPRLLSWTLMGQSMSFVWSRRETIASRYK